MDVNRYLSRALEAERRIRDIQEQRQHLWDIATRTTPVLSGMPGSQTEGRAQVVLAQMADLDMKLQAEMDQLTQVIEDVGNTIRQVPNEKQRRLLHLRYLCGKTWRDIQRELGYTNGRSIYYTHRAAKHTVLSILKERDLEWIRQVTRQRGSLAK